MWGGLAKVSHVHNMSHVHNIDNCVILDKSFVGSAMTSVVVGVLSGNSRFSG